MLISDINQEDMQHTVRALASQIQASTKEINRNITNISDISNQTATGAEQSSAASHELAQLSESLQQEIEAFKV